MFFHVTVFMGLVSFGLAGEGRSPHADLVEELMKSPDGAKYSSNILQDGLLDVPGLIAKYGYPVETHEVITSDGYILRMHRIPYGRDQSSSTGNRPVVFMMHGMLSSSADYVITGPEKALGYMLADAGYDVWMGNARGNYYSRRHITLDPDDSQTTAFWRFSWDEIGHGDLPAFIDHILATTGQSKMHYVGHSQGGTAFLVLTSTRPEYNDKFISFHGLAPASFFINNEFSPILTVAPYERIIEGMFFRFGSGELLGRNNLFIFAGIGSSLACSDTSYLLPLCTSIPLLGDIIESINTTLLPAKLGHAPAGISVRQLAHYGQSINNGGFRRFDYGLLGNWAEYRQFTPPEYEMSKVTTPAYLHYSLADNLVHFKDIYHLADSLPNTVQVLQVSRPSFSHLDFIWGLDAKDILNTQLLDAMRDAETRFG